MGGGGCRFFPARGPAEHRAVRVQVVRLSLRSSCSRASGMHAYDSMRKQGGCHTHPCSAVLTRASVHVCVASNGETACPSRTGPRPYIRTFVCTYIRACCGTGACIHAATCTAGHKGQWPRVCTRGRQAVHAYAKRLYRHTYPSVYLPTYTPSSC